MRAIYYRRQGTARDVIEVGERPTPSPGPGEVRVKVRFAGVNPSDVKRRTGLREPLKDDLIIPGSDGAGIIDAIGDGVPQSRIGEAVWTWNAQRGGRPFGVSAEYCCLPTEQAVAIPAGMPLEAGAGIGVPFRTAYYSLLADGPIEGRDVLVTGGAGACGFYAIQIARHSGARTITTTVSSPEKAAIAARAEPTAIIDYKREAVAKRLLEVTEGRGVSRISEVDLAGNLATSLAVIAQDGMIGAYASSSVAALPFYPLMAKNAAVRFIQCYGMPKDLRDGVARDLARWTEAGVLLHPRPIVFPFARAIEAHEAVEAGAVGKVMIEIGV